VERRHTVITGLHACRGGQYSSVYATQKLCLLQYSPVKNSQIRVDYGKRGYMPGKMNDQKHCYTRHLLHSKSL
jgi:hypothetical protein